MTKDTASVFQIRAVELHELAIHKATPGFSTGNFNFEINIETNIDRHQKVVITSTKVRINAEDKKTELGRVTCACVFSVDNFEEVVQMKNENTLGLMGNLAETINAISISTTRGLMASELRGTFLHYAFLPVVDVKLLTQLPPAS